MNVKHFCLCFRFKIMFVFVSHNVFIFREYVKEKQQHVLLQQNEMQVVFSASLSTCVRLCLR